MGHHWRHPPDIRREGPLPTPNTPRSNAPITRFGGFGLRQAARGQGRAVSSGSLTCRKTSTSAVTDFQCQANISSRDIWSLVPPDPLRFASLLVQLLSRLVFDSPFLKIRTKCEKILPAIVNIDNTKANKDRLTAVSGHGASSSEASLAGNTGRTAIMARAAVIAPSAANPTANIEKASERNSDKDFSSTRSSNGALRRRFLSWPWRFFGLAAL